MVLSALARVGSNDAGEIEKAFATGAPHLRVPAGADLTLLPAEDCGVDPLAAALDRLALAAPIIKKNLIEGAMLVVAILFLFLGNIRAAFITAPLRCALFFERGRDLFLLCCKS